jgi:hypothetical protein
MTIEQIEKVCEKHLKALSELANQKTLNPIIKMGALQQELAIMRLRDELIRISEEKPRQTGLF